MMKNDKENTQNISRVVTLIPWVSEDKFWKEKVYKFTITNNTEKVEYYNKKKKKEKDDEKKQKIEDKINECKSLIEIAENKGEINQKMALDYTYSLIREAMESEARRKNYILSYVYAELVAMRASQMEYKEICKKINELLKPAYRKKVQTRVVYTIMPRLIIYSKAMASHLINLLLEKSKTV